MSYKLDSKKAREGDKGGNQRIDSTGKYTGVFTVAKKIIATTGTVGMEFTFKDDTGAEARFLSLYLTKTDGETLSDFNKLNAIMACMKVRETKEKVMPITEYDFNAGQVVTHDLECYPELMNKPIGLVLQKEEYIKANNDIGFKMNIYSVFNSSTNQTAMEVLDQSKAERLEKIMNVVKDKKVSKQDKYQQEQVADNQTDFDDDFPFD